MKHQSSEQVAVTCTIDATLYQTYQRIAERISRHRRQALSAETIMAICLRRYAQEHLGYVEMHNINKDT